MPFSIVQGDITKMKTDVIVNAANNYLRQGGGVCGSVFQAAGPEKLKAACDEIGRCETGEAVMTPGFGLEAKAVVHTVGPVWQGGGHHEEPLLESCYARSLELAEQHGFQSIAFPLISSGIFGYPKIQAQQVAVRSIGSYLEASDMAVFLVIFKRSSYELPSSLTGEIDRILSVDRQVIGRPAGSVIINLEQFLATSERHVQMDLDDARPQENDACSQQLLQLIDLKGLSDSEVCRKANIDRRLFAKIRSDPQVKISKVTAQSMGIALEQEYNAFVGLLSLVGFSLSPDSRTDRIVEYFIQNRMFDIYKINQVLFAYGEAVLVS